MISVAPPQRNGEGPNFHLDGVLFKVVVGGDYERQLTDTEGVVLLKPWAMFEQLLTALGNLELRRMLEFGIWQGGSAVLWALATRVEKYVAIDLKPESFQFPPQVREHPRMQSVSLHWRTSQDNRAAVESIIAREFDGPLDLVVDDCSHQYALSKATFEHCFPKLRPGGYYVIEDWNWAHYHHTQDEQHRWAKSPALTNLIFELVVLAGADRGIIPSLHVFPGFTLIERGPAALDAGFTIQAHSRNRGRTLVPI